MRSITIWHDVLKVVEASRSGWGFGQDDRAALDLGNCIFNLVISHLEGLERLSRK